MTMLERVARAIAISRYGDDGYREEDDGTQYWELCENDARAAMQAMRQPTDAMLDAAEGVVVGYNDIDAPDGSEIYLFQPCSTDAWRAMIDAELETPTAAKRED